MKETVTAHYFAARTGLTINRAGQLLSKKGYKLDKRENGKPMFQKDKVDALAATYIERMRPLSKLEATREDLRELLSNINNRELCAIMKHEQFPVPSRLFMKVAGGAPPIKVWLIADILAVDVQKLLTEVNAGHMKRVDQVKCTVKIDTSSHFFAFISGRNMLNIQSRIEA